MFYSGNENDTHMPALNHGFSLDGGHLVLDFANTLDNRAGPGPEDRIPDYSALLAFAEATGLIDRDARLRLSYLADRRPHEAAAVRAAASALREAIYGAGLALVDGDEPDPRDLQIIAREAARGHASAAFTHDGDGFCWSWDQFDDTLDLPLWQLANAAIDFLTHQDLTRLRICAADDCGWIFLDETRNRSRKWCDMATCGNRAKAARYRGRRG